MWARRQGASEFSPFPGIACWTGSELVIRIRIPLVIYPGSFIRTFLKSFPFSRLLPADATVFFGLSDFPKSSNFGHGDIA
jgi:hypothetical protein